MWLEGVRVNPNYRRSRIATQLLANMIQYGRRNRAVQASAIVELTNVASQRMMEKSGFAILSRWAYYSSEARPKSGRSAARLATMRELESIWEYLQHSKIYDLSAKLYMKSWRWYPLDKRALKSLIKEKQVILAGRPVCGVAIMNRHGYWDRKNILQIVYLDAASDKPLRHLVSFAKNIYLEGRFEEFQLVCHDSKKLTSFIEKVMIKDEEKFLLYNKIFTARAIPSR
jgi:hypothetical protein